MAHDRYGAMLEKANERAQRRFHRMLERQTYADPTDRHTRLYVQAERLIDHLIGESSWEQSKASFDALQLADTDAPSPNDRYESASWAASARGLSMPGGQSGYTESEARWAWGNR